MILSCVENEKRWCAKPTTWSDSYHQSGYPNWWVWREKGRGGAMSTYCHWSALIVWGFTSQLCDQSNPSQNSLIMYTSFRLLKWYNTLYRQFICKQNKRMKIHSRSDDAFMEDGHWSRVLKLRVSSERSGENGSDLLDENMMMDRFYQPGLHLNSEASPTFSLVQSDVAFTLSLS